MISLANLRTERLVLRPGEECDVSSIALLAGAREIAATTVRIPHPYTEDHARQFIFDSRRAAELGLAARFAICAAATDTVCGYIGLEIESSHEHAEMGFWIGVPYWRRGYCTEAANAMLNYGFEVLKLRRIHAHHFLRNPASGAVLRKIGMRYEGRLRQHICKWGEFVDLELYGILNSEHADRKPERESSRPTKP